MKKKFNFKKIYPSRLSSAAWIYGSLSLGFILWMTFLDTNSWRIQWELQEDIDRLEAEKEKLEEDIWADEKIIEKLENLDSLEYYAREKYLFKKEGESIFLIDTSGFNKN